MQEVIDASASSVPAVRLDDFVPGVVPRQSLNLDEVGADA